MHLKAVLGAACASPRAAFACADRLPQCDDAGTRRMKKRIDEIQTLCPSLVHANRLAPKWRHQLLVQTGNLSYELYLARVFTLCIVSLVLHRLVPTLPLTVVFVLLFVVTVVIRYLFCVLVERPLHRFLKTRLGRARCELGPA